MASGFHTSRVAISDGFEVWLRRLDEELAEAQPGKTSQDYDALLLFKNYENGIPASQFVANPDGPIEVSTSWKKRLRSPATATKPLYWHMLGLVVILFSIFLYQEVGMKGYFDGLDESQKASETLRASIRNLPPRDPERIKPERQLIDTHSHELDGITELVFYTFIPIRIIWLVTLMMFAGAMNRYLALNYLSRMRIEKMFAKIGLRSKSAPFPEA